MVVWGRGTDIINLGNTQNKYCNTCKKARQFSIVLVYKYEHLWWFGRVYEKTYHLLCDICQHGSKLDQNDIEQKLIRIPIPFMRKYGFIALISVLGVIGMISALSRGA